MIIPYDGESPVCDSSVFIAAGSAVIGSVRIGADSSVWFGTVIRADISSVSIGERSNIQDLSVIHVSGDCPVVIGNDVTIGHRCVIHGAAVGDRTLIGMGSILLDGSVIGSDSIVGAGSLVTKGKAFPPRSLIMGSPAVRVRDLTDDEVVSLSASALRYVGLKDTYHKV